MPVLDYHGFKNVVNRYLLRRAGGEKRPVFFDIGETRPELRTLERAWSEIRAEVDALLAERVAMPRYHDVNGPSREISSTTEGRWNVFLLELLGHRPERNRARCPATCAALEKIPTMVQAFFSVLEAGKSIPLHEGPYLGYLRYHLGVRVPAENPPTIRVAGQPYTWKDGEGMIFDDSWPHEVANESREPRVVLIVDIRRPLPTLADWVNRAVLRLAFAPFYGRGVVRKARNYSDTGETPPPPAFR
ncbi:MAG: aspartyl/asparaginyl beta-hydroxylase domain-containing protein [Gammaproteobacteria bacterium]